MKYGDSVLEEKIRDMKVFKTIEDFKVNSILMENI